MDEINNNLLSTVQHKDIKKLNLKPGDVVLINYNSVGDMIKLKDIIGIVLKIKGKSWNKGLKMLLKKGGINIKMVIPLNHNLLHDIKVLRRFRVTPKHKKLKKV